MVQVPNDAKDLKRIKCSVKVSGWGECLFTFIYKRKVLMPHPKCRVITEPFIMSNREREAKMPVLSAGWISFREKWPKWCGLELFSTSSSSTPFHFPRSFPKLRRSDGFCSLLPVKFCFEPKGIEREAGMRGVDEYVLNNKKECSIGIIGPH